MIRALGGLDASRRRTLSRWMGRSRLPGAEELGLGAVTTGWRRCDRVLDAYAGSTSAPLHRRGPARPKPRGRRDAITATGASTRKRPGGARRCALPGGAKQKEIAFTVATVGGGGRGKGELRVTQITCHARGRGHSSRSAHRPRLGGTGQKVIRLGPDGSRRFAMNDGCAAGAGKAWR